MTTHYLKTWPVFFVPVHRGEKCFEVRKDDRGFEVGDVVLLREWNPDTRRYTHRAICFRITYKLSGGQFGVEQGYCVLSLQQINRGERDYVSGLEIEE